MTRCPDSDTECGTEQCPAQQCKRELDEMEEAGKRIVVTLSPAAAASLAMTLYATLVGVSPAGRTRRLLREFADLFASAFPAEGPVRSHIEEGRRLADVPLNERPILDRRTLRN